MTGKSRRARIIATALCVLMADVVAMSQVAVPTITLTPGELFFRLDGTPSLLLGTNPTGWMTSQWDTLLGYAGVNERIVRIHITNGKAPHPTEAGQVDEPWAIFWDGVFTTAEQNGLLVLPVIDGWADWSETNPGTQTWANNIYNAANPICTDGIHVCGTAASPVELLQDTPTRALWLGYLRTLVNRWKGRPNILGWEVFSEISLITGATEADGVLFVEAAAAVIRAEDTSGRPVTASLAGVIDWPTLATSSIDFIQIHPYATATGGNLDELILDTVRDRRTLYPDKPIFIGESGLDSRAPVTFNTLVLDPEAPVGINQAIWAAAVSGAMNGRMLWFEDGYDQFHFLADGVTRLNLHDGYANASAPVAAFLQGVDYSGFAPITLVTSADITGATLGNDDLVLGWVKDGQSVAPDWPARLLTGQTATVFATGVSHDWLVTFYDTDTGAEVQSEYANQAADGSISITLPDFDGSIAFQIRAVPPIDVVIDIIPGGSRNRINPNIKGRFRVAILTTHTADGEPIDFEASSVAPATVLFGPGGALALANALVDVDGDGDLDLGLAFRKRDTGLVCGDTVASLTGETLDGRAIAGSDVVTIVGCP